jgi:hypothetical protein
MMGYVFGRRVSTYSEVEHARLLGLAEVLALSDLGVGVQLSMFC